jgi:hypothetical protein
LRWHCTGTGDSSADYARGDSAASTHADGGTGVHHSRNSAPETVGDSVPENIKLFPLPPEVIQKEPQARSHTFFIKDDEIVIVSSSDRRIADVIKKKSTD